MAEFENIKNNNSRIKIAKKKLKENLKNLII